MEAQRGHFVIPGLCGRPQDIEDARVMGYLQGKLLTGRGTNPRERSVSQSKLTGGGHLKSALTPGDGESGGCPTGFPSFGS